MITLTREEAQQVLDALEGVKDMAWDSDTVAGRKLIETLRARLSAPEPDYRDVVIKGDLWRIEFLPDHAASVVLVRANYEAQPEPEPVAWQPIDTAPKGKIVLVHYKNRLGNGRTMRARYYLPETLESDESESGWADEGWYEESEAYEYLMPLEGEPTHWMPLPPAPDAAPPQREWQGLTDEEMFDCLAQTDGEAKRLPLGFKWFAEAIEAKLKEKNT